MTDCYCDYESCDFYAETRPIARKSHRCCECGHTIRPGDRYESARGLYEGIWSQYRTCCYCLAIRDMIESRSCCFCWAHHNMLENMRDELEWNGHKMPELGMAVGRILVERYGPRRAAKRSASSQENET